MLREIKKKCGVPCLSSDPPAWPWPAPFCPLVTARAGGHGQGRLGDVPLCAPSLQGRAGLAGEQPCGGAAAGGAAAGAAGAAGGRGPGRPARTAGPARCSAAPSAPGSRTSYSHCPGPRWHKHRPAARAAGWVPPPLSMGGWSLSRLLPALARGSELACGHRVSVAAPAPCPALPAPLSPRCHVQATQPLGLAVAVDGQDTHAAVELCPRHPGSLLRAGACHFLGPSLHGELAGPRGPPCGDLATRP